jgi:hypothetical protein
MLALVCWPIWLSEAEPDDLAGKVLKKLPGKRNPPTITLRRPLTTDLALAAWHETAVDGQTKAAQKEATLVTFDAAGPPGPGTTSRTPGRRRSRSARSRPEPARC